MEISDLMQGYFSPGVLNLEPAEKFSEWETVESPTRLIKDYKFSSRLSLYEFLRQIFLYEDAVQHHGKISVSHLEVRVEVYTHDIDTVPELDVEYATVADQIYFDSAGVR